MSWLCLHAQLLLCSTALNKCIELSCFASFLPRQLNWIISCLMCDYIHIRWFLPSLCCAVLKLKYTGTVYSSPSLATDLHMFAMPFTHLSDFRLICPNTQVSQNEQKKWLINSFYLLLLRDACMFGDMALMGDSVLVWAGETIAIRVPLTQPRRSGQFSMSC